MRNIHRWAIVLCVACVIQAPAQATPGGSGTGLVPLPAGSFLPFDRLSGGNLIKNKSVQEDLKLTAEQVKDIWAEVRKVTEKYKDESRKLNELAWQEALKPRDLTRQPLSVVKGKELEAKMDEEVRKAVDAILKPEQMKRLKQIALQDAAQRTGAGVFLYADVAKELQLTNQQTKWAASVFTQTCHDTTAAAFAQAREEFPKIVKKSMDDVRSVLSDEQKKKLADLMGRPFTLVADATSRAPFRIGNAHLLSDQRVQKELKLTAEQVKSVQDGLAKVQEKYREEISKVAGGTPGGAAVPGGSGGGLDPKQLAALTKNVREENQKVIAGILKPEQVKRLKQIELQFLGVNIVQNEEVVKALNLTADQKRQMNALVEEFYSDSGKLASSPAERRNMDQLKLFREAIERIPSLLTPEQRKTWKELTGEPFYPEPAPKNRPADGKVGHIKVEARGRVIAKENKDGSTPYFLRVDQKEWLIRTKFDKAGVVRHVLDLKDTEVVLTGNLAWLPKGARTDNDDDYALGFVIQEKAQLERLDPKDRSPHYIKVEARGDWMIQDNSLVILVQLQETPAKRVVVSGPWRIWGLDRLTSVLKTEQATIAGYATWEVRPDLVIFRLHAPQLVDPPLDAVVVGSDGIPRDQVK